MTIRITTETLLAWQTAGRRFALIDTLPAASFTEAHLPGAINIVSDDILARAPAQLPDRETVIVVYCASASCQRAQRSAERLQSLGYRQVMHYQGGRKSWAAAGLPLVHGG